MSAFSSFGLSGSLITALKECGYHAPTPIQQKAIPLVLKGRDLMASAQTGTGKTAGFALPVLQRLVRKQKQLSGSVTTVVLVPTRELADQVGKQFVAYSRHLSVRTTVIYGGVPFDPQLEALSAGTEILVATPGRLLDFLQRGHLTLERVDTLVLDEADRMLDLGFIEAVTEIIEALPTKRQSLLFSATFSDAIRELADTVLHKPEVVEVAPANTAAETVEQTVCRVEWDDKPDTVRYLVEEGRWSRVLVFIRTKRSADDLVSYLQQEGVSAAAIHSNKSQHLRTKTMNSFRSGRLKVLVATDVAARGIDIPELPLVINYDLPRVAEDYVHRIGRSGRAGESGRAISLLSGSERKWMQAIEALLERQFTLQPLPYFENGVEQPQEILVQEKRPSGKRSGSDEKRKAPLKKAAKSRSGKDAHKGKGASSKGRTARKEGPKGTGDLAEKGEGQAQKKTRPARRSLLG